MNTQNVFLNSLAVVAKAERKANFLLRVETDTALFLLQIQMKAAQDLGFECVLARLTQDPTHYSMDSSFAGTTDR